MKFDVWVFLFRISEVKVQSRSDRTRTTGTLREDRYSLQFWSIFAHFFTEWELFQPNVVEEIKIHILCSTTIVLKSCHLWDKMKKYCRARQDAGDNMGHAHCRLDTEGYRHTLGICNTFCLYAAVMVAWTRLNVTQHVHCLSWVPEVNVVTQM